MRPDHIEQGALPEAGPDSRSPTVAIPYTLIHTLDEINALITFATQPETAPLVEAELRNIGLLQTRMQLLVSLVLARQPSRKLGWGHGTVVGR